MTTRRTILKAGAALPALSLVGAALTPSRFARAAASVLALERFIYDPRFAEAFDIAQHVAGLGTPTMAVADDLMALWYDELDLLWKERPRALAGVTMHEALFVLDTLAMDRGMRVVYRGEHGLVEDGRIAHRLAGPAQTIESMKSSERQTQWQLGLASAMSALPLGRPEAAVLEFVSSAAELSLRDVPLVSWVIAPRDQLALTLPQ